MDTDSIRERLLRALPYLAAAAIVIGFVNFFWFFTESIALGGDALNGRIVDGHYFLGSHGTYTEVDEGTWAWSQFHATSVILTHPLALAGMFFFAVKRVMPTRMAGAADPKLTELRADLVRNSGSRLDAMTTGGRIGGVRLTKPLISLSVYPNGFILKPQFMPELAILAAEILSIRRRRVFGTDAVEISHLGTGGASPILLYGRLDDPAIASLREVAAGAGVLSTLPVMSAPGAALDPEEPSVEPEPEATSVAPEPPRAPRWRGGLEGIEPPWLATMLGLFGLGVGVFLVIMGLVWAVPKLGPFGVVWTIFAVVITAVNAWRFFRRR